MEGVVEIPSQQEKIQAHSFVLGPEVRIQYTYAGIHLATDTNTYTWNTNLGYWIWIQHEYIYAKKLPGIWNIFMPAQMVVVVKFKGNTLPAL